MQQDGNLTSIDIPQADSLETVRNVVAAIFAGATSVSEIEDSTGYSGRHVRYRLQTGRILGVIKGGFSVTKLGQSLLETKTGSEEELALFRKAVNNSRVVKMLIPDLLQQKVFDKVEFSRKLSVATGLAPATAERRAQVN